MSLRWKWVALLTGVSLFGLGNGIALWVSTSQMPLPNRVMLGSLSLEGATLNRLPNRLQTLQATLAELPVVVEQMPQHHEPLQAWGVRLDVYATAEAIQRAWKALPLWERLRGQEPLIVAPVWHVESTQFEKQLQRYRSLTRPPKDARVRYEQGTVLIEPSVEGLQLDPKRSLRNLLEALHTVPRESVRFSLAFETQAPRIPTEKVSVITGEMAHYTTRFPGYQVQRNHNIRLASAALDGQILLPGERLSYNAVVGRRTSKQGYKQAPVIINGEKRLGIGGGICQVSSTLFNAALLADLKIVRRANHSIPVAYVPLGRDATVTDGGYDLVIENPHPHPIALSVEVGRSSLTVRVLGVPNPDKRVVLTTQMVRPTKQSSSTGGTQKASKAPRGRQVILWRTVYQQGQLVRRERIAVSTYRTPRPDRQASRPLRAESAPEPTL